MAFEAFRNRGAIHNTQYPIPPVSRSQFAKPQNVYFDPCRILSNSNEKKFDKINALRHNKNITRRVILSSKKINTNDFIEIKSQQDQHII